MDRDSHDLIARAFLRAPRGCQPRPSTPASGARYRRLLVGSSSSWLPKTTRLGTVEARAKVTSCSASRVAQAPRILLQAQHAYAVGGMRQYAIGSTRHR